MTKIKYLTIFIDSLIPLKKKKQIQDEMNIDKAINAN